VSGKEERGGDQANIIRESVMTELGNGRAAQIQDDFVRPIGDDQDRGFLTTTEEAGETAVSLTREGGDKMNY